MLDGADLPKMPSQRTGYFSRLLLAPLLASRGLGEARQSQRHWVAPGTAAGWWRAPCRAGRLCDRAVPRSPWSTAARWRRGPTEAAALNWSRRRLSAGVGVQGRGTRSQHWELRGAYAGLMHLFFFFLLCKAGRCHRMSARPWQAVRACILCSGS